MALNYSPKKEECTRKLIIMYKSATKIPETGGEELLTLSFIIDLEKICPMTITDQIAIAKNNKGNQMGRSPASMRSLLLRISENLMIRGLAMILNNAPVPNSAINDRV
jgi:hypothetical protein